jgi:hypothetical protein
MSESTDNLSSRTVNRASAMKERIKEDGKQRIDEGKRNAADQMEGIADALGAAGSRLGESQPTLAGYAAKLADGVGGVATRLRDGNIEDLYRDVRRIATQHPGMFLLGSAAVGLAIARFMKSDMPDNGASSDFSTGASSDFSSSESRRSPDYENRAGV